MISHKYKCIFIHIPKCGGSSIEKFLRTNAEGLGPKKEDGLEHKMRLGGLAKTINLYADYFTFTFVRNPFDRFVSIWKHSERGTGYYFKRPRKKLSLKEYACLVNDGDPQQLSLFDKYHTKKQIEFILDYNKEVYFGVSRVDKANCNFIGRLERIQDDFEQVCEIMGIGNKQLPYEMISPDRKRIARRHYSTYYDKDTLEIVKNIYSEDIALLDYFFERKAYSLDFKPTFNVLTNFFRISKIK
jgi:hypothetical protein